MDIAAECPNCFGKASKSQRLAACLSCEYAESCAYCARNDGSECDRRLGHVSYERYAWSQETAAEPCAFDRDEDGEGEDGVRRVIEYLLDIDNYTAELASSVLHGDATTASELAREFGVTRQAIHRKLVDCCTRHPELRKLFIARLCRCRRILFDSARLKARQERNDNQMEFDFNA